MTPAPFLCALYVPGDRPDRFAKALATDADLVVIDLEDSVRRKDAARQQVRQYMLSAPDITRISIRVNAGSQVDVDLIAELTDAGRRPTEVRVPKVQSPEDLRALATLGIPLHALIESARGVLALPEIAMHPEVVAVGLGEADLAGELGVYEESALYYCRSALVLAAAAAELRPPAMSVFADIRNLTGLTESCRVGRRLGLVGRNAVHPAQIPVIREAFAPTAEEIADARATLAALESAARSGSGVATTVTGSMVDAAMRRRAERVIAVNRAFDRE